MAENQNYKAIIELLSNAKGKDELDVVRLRDEIRSEVSAGDKTLAQFLKLLGTFQEIIPNEKQRYHAALKALSATSGLGLQDVLESSDAQLRELRKIEGTVLSAMKEYSDELREMDSRLGSIRAETARLREQLLELGKDEKELIGAMAAQVKMRKGIEQAAGKVLAEIGSELTVIRNKTEQFSSEESSLRAGTPQAPLESETREVPEIYVPEEKGPMPELEDRGAMSEIDEILAPPSAENLRKCPMCEGPLNYYGDSSTWICYTCGHEVSDKEINPDSD